MDMMMMTQMTLLQQQISGSTRAIAPAVAPPAPILSNTDTITAARPRQLNIPDISLAQFCTRYRIEEKDRLRLEKMEFHPGDPLEDLGPDEWKDFGGFPQLSWSRIKVKNQEFISHVEQGLWSV
jgi:hypothetical protein